MGISTGNCTGLVSMLWELGSAYAQGEEHNHIHLGCSHLGQSRKRHCTKDIMVGKIILLFFIADSFLNISIAFVLDDRREPRVRKETQKMLVMGGGRMGQDSSCLRTSYQALSSVSPRHQI